MSTTKLKGRKLKRALAVEIIGSLLLILIVHTLVSTFIQLQSLKNLLAFYTRHTTAVAWGILAAELIVAVLLFVPRTRLWGFVGTLLLVAFATYKLKTTSGFPHDFGGVLNQITNQQRLVLFGVVAVLSVAGIVLQVTRRKRVVAPEQPIIVFT